MSYWVFKSLTQGLISILPQKYYLNYLLNKYLTKSLNLNNDLFELKLKECKKHLETYFSINSLTHRRLFCVFELGTGRFPILPFAFFLCGASRIFTIDRTSLLSLESVKEVLRFFIDYAERNDLVKILPWIQTDRVLELRKMAKDTNAQLFPQFLQKLNIYFLVCDARNTGLPPSSIDFFVSNTTLEYIPENILTDIFTEFRRLAFPRALMSHLIITSDHYADVDHSITPFNYLKYPGWMWWLFNNSLHYQNRLRLSDYCRIHEISGFEIMNKYNDLGLISDLKKIDISKDFSHYSIEDLLIIRSRVVSVLASSKEITRRNDDMH